MAFRTTTATLFAVVFTLNTVAGPVALAKDPCSDLLAIVKQQPFDLERVDPSPAAKRNAIRMLTETIPSLFTSVLRQVVRENPALGDGAGLWLAVKSKSATSEVQRFVKIVDSNTPTRHLVEDLLEEITKHKELLQLDTPVPTLELTKDTDFRPPGGEVNVSSFGTFMSIMAVFASPIFLSQLVVGPHGHISDIFIMFGGWEAGIAYSIYKIAKYEIIPSNKRLVENRRRKKIYKAALAKLKNAEASVVKALQELTFDDPEWSGREAKRLADGIEKSTFLLPESLPQKAPETPYDFKDNASDEVLAAFWAKDGDVILAQMSLYLSQFSKLIDQGRPSHFSEDLITSLNHVLHFSETSGVLTAQVVRSDLIPALQSATRRINDETKTLKTEDDLMVRLQTTGLETLKSIKDDTEDQRTQVKSALGLLERARILIQIQMRVLERLNTHLIALQAPLLLPPSGHGLLEDSIREKFIELAALIRDSLR